MEEKRDSTKAEVIRLILLRSTAREAVFLERRMARRGEFSFLSAGVAEDIRVKYLPNAVFPVLVSRSRFKRRERR